MRRIKRPKITNVNRVKAVLPLWCAEKGYKVKRLVTSKREGSDKLLLGVAYLDPGCNGYVWRFSNIDEAYYIVKGKISLSYDNRKLEAKEGDAIFIPAGWKYELANPGPEMAMVIFAVTPPPRGAN